MMTEKEKDREAKAFMIAVFFEMNLRNIDERIVYNVLSEAMRHYISGDTYSFVDLAEEVLKRERKKKRKTKSKS